MHLLNTKAGEAAARARWGEAGSALQPLAFSLTTLLLTSRTYLRLVEIRICGSIIRSIYYNKVVIMIDFQNASFLKLKPVSPDTFAAVITPMFVDGEKILGTYQSIRDGVVFTNKRIITINVQGITGKKKDFTSLPYSKIQAYSVETAGVLDLDSELELWFSGMGKVKFEFVSRADVSSLCRTISEFVL